MADRIAPNLYAADARVGRAFFTDVLGLSVAMELDFITTYRGDRPGAQISVIRYDPADPKPAYSVGVDDVAAVHDRAVESGAEIVYPLRDEPWGVRRFFVRDPTGAIANIVQHKS